MTDYEAEKKSYPDAVIDMFENREIPREFRKAMESYAWEQGHANGHREVLYVLDDLCDIVQPAIAEYTKRLLKESVN